MEDFLFDLYVWSCHVIKQTNDVCCKLIFPIYYDDTDDSDSENEIDEFVVVNRDNRKCGVAGIISSQPSKQN